MGKASDVTDGGRFVGEEVDGIRLQNGERLKVTWPDGEVEVVKSVVESNGGQPGRACCMVAYHGVAAKVLLMSAANIARVSRACNCSDGSCPVCQERWQAAAEKAKRLVLARRARAAKAAEPAPALLPGEKVELRKTRKKKGGG